jgi:hypothetical protein
VGIEVKAAGATGSVCRPDRRGSRFVEQAEPLTAPDQAGARSVLDAVAPAR